MLKKILAIILLCVLAVLVSRNYLAKKIITEYAKKKLNAEVTLERADLSFKGVSLYNLKLSRQEITSVFPKTEFRFDFPSFLRPRVSGLIMEGGYLKAENIASLVEEIKGRFGNDAAAYNRRRKKEEKPSLHLDLSNVRVELTGPESLHLKGAFSFQGDIEGSRIKALKSAGIYDCSVKFGGFKADLSLIKSQSGLYELKIYNVGIKNKKIQDVLITLAPEGNGIILEKIQTDFLGSFSYIKGFLEFKDLDSCLNLEMKDLSLANAAGLLDSKRDILFEGLFNGSIKVCFNKAKIGEVFGEFNNDKGGLLQVKKDAPLTFLQRHLDKGSYDTFIDNIKDYQYNKAQIKLVKKGNILVFDAEFDSNEKGARSININYHIAEGVVAK